MDSGISSKFNRIEKDYSAVLLRRKNIKKNTNLHEKRLKNNTFKNARIQRGLMDAALLNRKKFKEGLVIECISPLSITVKAKAKAKATATEKKEEIKTASLSLPSSTNTPTPSNSINALVQSLPAKVIACFDTELNKPIYLPLRFPAWRDLDERTKPYFYNLALAELEALSNNEYRLIPFVYNITTGLENAIQSQIRDRVDFLRDRLQKGLNEALQRPKDNQAAFWFSFETAMQGQPHIQGSLLLRLEELKAARKVFYKLARDMTPEEKQGLLRFRSSMRKQFIEKSGQLYTDLNWTDYNLKERAYTRIFYNNLKPIVAVSQPLIKHTTDYYERFRYQFKQRSNAASAPKPNIKPRSPLWGTW